MSTTNNNSNNSNNSSKSRIIKGTWRFESDDVVTTVESTDLFRLIHDVSFIYKFNEKITDVLIDDGMQVLSMQKRNGENFKGRIIKIA